MGYIVKLIPEDLYLVPSDCQIGLTEYREKALAEGLFHDYAEANAKAKLFRKEMAINIDYVVESSTKE